MENRPIQVLRRVHSEAWLTFVASERIANFDLPPFSIFDKADAMLEEFAKRKCEREPQDED